MGKRFEIRDIETCPEEGSNIVGVKAFCPDENGVKTMSGKCGHRLMNEHTSHTDTQTHSRLERTSGGVASFTVSVTV